MSKGSVRGQGHARGSRSYSKLKKGVWFQWNSAYYEYEIFSYLEQKYIYTLSRLRLGLAYYSENCLEPNP